MAIPTRDCSRQVELVSFIEKEKSGQMRSGWFLDRYFLTRTTRAERIELRKYTKDDVTPLWYTEACGRPQELKGRARSVEVNELSWPTIKARTKVDGCDVDDFRITPQGNLIMPGRARYNEAANWAMMDVLDRLRMTHIGEAINVLKYGSYTIRGGPNSEADVLGTVDFKRERAKYDFVNSDGKFGSWDQKCADPFRQFERVLQDMGRCGAGGGRMDVIYSRKAWDWMLAHSEREGIKYRMPPPLGNAFEQQLIDNFTDTTYMGATHGGRFQHFVTDAVYQEFDPATKSFVETPVMAPGEVLLVNRGALRGQRLFRTITSDNAEQLPRGSTYFLYDDPTDPTVYKREERCWRPWIEEYHLMIPGNVDATALLCVIAPDAPDPCVECEDCFDASPEPAEAP